jgi:hypothetical protein
VRYLRLAALLLPASAGILLGSFGGCVISFGGYELAPDGGAGNASGGTTGTSSTGSGGMGGASGSSTTASTGGTGGQCTGTLDPNLAVPAPGTGMACDPKNVMCPGAAAACIIAGPCSFECVTCVECVPFSSACSTATDCDPSLACYNHQCVEFCKLGGVPCGGSTCTAVGNTVLGVCLP